MDSEIFFADIKRGIFGSRSGNLYLTNPGTFNLVDDPFIVPYPFRIIVSDDYDPFAVIFTESGYVYIMNLAKFKWELKAKLPVDVGVIDSLQVKDDGKSIELRSNKGSFLFQNGWMRLSQPLESLIVKEDQKVYAQATQLENDICTAKLNEDFDKFTEAVQRYLIYLANYSTEDVLIRIWYDLIKQSYPFDKEKLLHLWDDAILLLSTVDRLSAYIDELKMSIKE